MQIGKVSLYYFFNEWNSRTIRATVFYKLKLENLFRYPVRALSTCRVPRQVSYKRYRILHHVITIDNMNRVIHDTTYGLPLLISLFDKSNWDLGE